jgi:hypothetical protein
MEQRVIGLSHDIIHLQEMQMLLSQTTPERRAIYDTLATKSWFQHTDHELQKKLLSLPDKGRENHNGFLEDLASRPEEIANIKVERMVDLPHGSFALVPKFEVSRLDNPGTRYTYEYVSWRDGPKSGGKGVVFVEKDGKITHGIILHGGQFATGTDTYKSFGGFMDKGVDGVVTPMDRMKAEIIEEIGSDNVTIQKMERLGTVHPDVGMTNESPDLFAAVISVDDLYHLPKNPINKDMFELKTGTVVFPIESLPNVVLTNTDGYFLSTIARAWAKGIVPFPTQLTGKSVGFSNN